MPDNPMDVTPQKRPAGADPAPPPAPVPVPPQQRSLSKLVTLGLVLGGIVLLLVVCGFAYMGLSRGLRIASTQENNRVSEKSAEQCARVQWEIYDAVQIGTRRGELRGMTPSEMFAYVRDEVGYEADDSLLDGCPNGGTYDIYISEGTATHAGIMLYTVEVYCSVHTPTSDRKD